MRILLLGNTGQLGWQLERTLVPLGEVVALDYPDLDLNAPESVRGVIANVRPEVIVNATAYTAVDRAESESEIAFQINARAPGIMAEEAKTLGALFVHYSTDYVFDGEKGEPYTEADMPNPINIYGQSKLAGEQAVESVGGKYLIFRTSWVYSLRRVSFVTKVLEWSRSNKTLRIVSDQVSSPTWCRMLAEVTAHLLVKGGERPAAWLGDRVGLYHIAGNGVVSRFEWAQEILNLDPKPSEQVVQDLLPARSEDFPTQTRRPLFSALACNRFVNTFGLQLPDWRTALKLAMESA